MNSNFKTMSGSNRDKTEATPKQNKWRDPFYRQARGMGAVMLKSHKVDSIRESVSADEYTKGLFKSFLSGVSSFFSRIFKRKVIA